MESEFQQRRELRIELKFKNAVLYNALLEIFPRKGKFAGCHPLDIPRAADKLGVSHTYLRQLLNLRISPYRTNRRKAGQLSPYALEICRRLGFSPEDLFPVGLYRLNIPALFSLDIPTIRPLSEASALMLPSPEDSAIREELPSTIAEILATLTPREEKVIRMRFGLDDGVSRTLEEIGDYFAVNRERIRQIEWKALRKLRHPKLADRLRGALNP